MSDGDDLNWLQNWYLSHCGGEWEHHRGIKVETLDNPGWWLKIDLTGTSLEGRPFLDVKHGAPTDNLDGWRATGSWWSMGIREGKFDAACGPLDLVAVIRLFRRWAEQPG